MAQIQVCTTREATRLAAVESVADSRSVLCHCGVLRLCLLDGKRVNAFAKGASGGGNRDCPASRHGDSASESSVPADHRHGRNDEFA